MERDRIQATWDEVSPFTTTPAPAHLPHVHAEGPVRYLLVSGELDDASWGLVGAFWLSVDGERGGFLVSPAALWHGSEMVRSYRGAVARGWSEEAIFSYWADLAGAVGTYMIDPEQRGKSLLQVARRVATI